MRISDWSSDVCSSDLHDAAVTGFEHDGALATVEHELRDADGIGRLHRVANDGERLLADRIVRYEIMRLVVPDPLDRILRHEHVDVTRKRVVSGKGGLVRVDLGGRRIIKKKKKN